MQHNDFLLTKIIATLGPASSSLEVISKLIREGVRVFRINFSHGLFSEYEALLKTIRKAEKETGTYVAVMGDLSGPKIRVGKVIESGVMLEKGQEVSFVKKAVVAGEAGTEFVFSSTLPEFVDEVKARESILLDDGNVSLESIRTSGKGESKVLHCKVINGGLITSAKGINLPDTELSLPSMTEKDFRCAEFAVEKGFDYLALSFVRSGADVKILKDKLVELGARPEGEMLTSGSMGFSKSNEKLKKLIPIISKIEKPQALKNLKDIVEETDGVMVARGDLGVEMDLAEVAILQKRIISLCQEYGKPVIVATQMLQSMLESPVPTRAEVSDVANAIFDGADAVMLSGETAVGKYPVETVKMMNRVAAKTNNYIKANNLQTGETIRKSSLSNRTAAIANGVRTIVEDISPKFLVLWTKLGGSAVYLSRYRMPLPIIVFSNDENRLRQLSVLYGIKPRLMDTPKSGSDFIKKIDKLMLAEKWAEKGDAIVIVSGDPIDRVGVTNRIVIHYIGELVD
ncbi:MAG TPA: pyruvate kinase [Bacteroidales bacterium]